VQVAILYGESRRLQVEVKKEQEREEAFARLKVLFPYTEVRFECSVLLCSRALPYIYLLT
jgi:hypothetical protein